MTTTEFVLTECNEAGIQSTKFKKALVRVAKRIRTEFGRTIMQHQVTAAITCQREQELIPEEQRKASRRQANKDMRQLGYA